MPRQWAASLKFQNCQAQIGGDFVGSTFENIWRWQARATGRNRTDDLFITSELLYP